MRAAIGASAAPYGYTLATWTTGAVLTHARGIPNAFEALSFMVGAVLGFAGVGSLAFGGVRERLDDDEPVPRLLLTSLHGPSVGLAIGSTYVIAGLVRTDLAWPLGAFGSTTVYLLAVAAEGMAAGYFEGRR